MDKLHLNKLVRTIATVGASLAMLAANVGTAAAATTIGTNISTDGTLTVVGNSSFGTVTAGTWNGAAIGNAYLAAGIDSAKIADGSVSNAEFQYLGNVTSDVQAQLGGKEGSIPLGTAAQYWRGDKTWQTLDKSAVGLGSVVNADTTNASNITSGTLSALRLPTAGTDLGAANFTIDLSNTNGTYVTHLTTDGTITATFQGSLTGNANTATALNSNPTDCAAGQFANAIDAFGNLACSANGSSLTNLSATNISSGTLGVAYGGTGNTAFTASRLISYDGSTMVSTSINPANVITVGYSAGGDLAVSYPNPTVIRLYGNPVSSATPNSTIPLLRWAGGMWTPSKADLSTDMTGALPVANGGTGTSTALTSGSVVFAGASGVYSQDNANLFWDDTNNRLGIGTTAPIYSADVAGEMRARVGIKAKSAGTTGLVGLAPGTTVYTGYVEWRLPAADGVDGTRLGYMGWDTSNVTMRLENGAAFAVTGGNFSVAGTVTATGGNSTNWNTAYGWGNHAAAGYATAASATAFTNKTGAISMWTNDSGYITAAGVPAAETDPQVGTLTAAKWCVSDGSVVNCAQDAPVLTSGAYADPAWITSLAGSKISGNISGNAANVTGTVAIANGGTGATTANAAFNALAPSQTGNSGKFLTSNGTDTSWTSVATTPGGSDKQVQFNDGSVMAGAANLYWDKTNNRLGIGTSTPTAQLDIKGSGTGRVMMGEWPGGNSYYAISLTGTLSTTEYNLMSSPGDKKLILNRGSGSDMSFAENSFAQMTLKGTTGNLGIGDVSPASLLTVGNGDLFQVNSTGAIAAAAGITSSGTITFSGLSTAGVVHNSAAGVLSTGAVALASEVTGILPVANGGTGATTANAAFNALAPSQTGNGGKFLTTNGTDTSWAVVTASGAAGGDLTGTYPNPTIAADSVALGTDTTGNYVLGVSAGPGLAVSGSAGEGWSPTVSLDYSAAPAGDPGLASNGVVFGTAGVVFEGATADANEGMLSAADMGADISWILPATGGTLSLDGHTHSGYATLTGTETLTNKTLTSPKVGTAVLDTNGNSIIGLSPVVSAVNYISVYNNSTGNNPMIAVTGDANQGLTMRVDGDGSFRLQSSNTGRDALQIWPSHSSSSSSQYGNLLMKEDLTANRDWYLQNASGVIPVGTSGNSLFFTTTGDTNIALPTTGTLVSTNATQTMTNKTLTSPTIGSSILDTNGNVMVGILPTASAATYLTFQNNTAGNNPILGVAGAANQGMTVRVDGSGAFRIQSTDANSDIIQINPYVGGTGQNSLTFVSADITANRAWTLPDKDGTVAVATSNSMAAGSIMFGNGGALTENNSQLYWNNGAQRLGIGTASPASMLSVGSGSPFQVDGSGSVMLAGSLSAGDSSGDQLTFAAASMFLKTGWNHAIKIEDATAGTTIYDLTIHGQNTSVNTANGGRLVLYGGMPGTGGTAGYVHVGSNSVSPTHSPGRNSLFVEDVLEVDGSAYFDGNIGSIRGISYTWPSAQSAAANYVLTNDGVGNLSWSAAGGGSAFVNGGNSFGADAYIGLNDNYSLNFETNAATAMTLQNDGDLAVDTNTLFVDAVNNRVGIGIAAPGGPLEVSGGSQQQVVRIGGTASSLTYPWNNPSIYITQNTNTANNFASLSFANANTNVVAVVAAKYTTHEANPNEDGQLTFWTANNGYPTQKMVITESGRVGIGASSPAQMLELASGNILLDRHPTSGDLNRDAYIGVGQADGSFGDSSVAGASIKFDSTADGGNSSQSIHFITHHTAVTGGIRMSVDKDGNVGIGDTTPASLLTVGSGDLFQVDSSGNVTVSGNFSQTGTGTFSTGTGAVSLNGNTAVASGKTLSTGGKVVYQPETILFSTAGTLTPTKSYVNLQCDVAANLSITLDETGAVAGQMLTVVVDGAANNAGSCYFAPTAGVQEVQSSGLTLDDFDSAIFMYVGDRWVQISSSNN
jgi:hypothetical protein